MDTTCAAAKRLERAVALAEIERTRFDWFTEPAVRFPLAAAYRGLGQPGRPTALPVPEPQRRPRRLVGLRPGRVAAGRSEEPAGEAAARSCRAEARPHLDGRLDDPVWQQAKPAALHSAQHDDADWPAEVMLAYDAEFLYLAVVAGNRQTRR